MSGFRLSSNQFYGGLNRRFDSRARRLASLGYRYTCSPFGAVFVRGSLWRLESIPAGLVMHADNRAFIDALRSPMRCRFEEVEGLADRLRSRLNSRGACLVASLVGE
jgi:hypothetical protein